MKRLLLLIFIGISTVLHAQETYDSIPPYEKNPTIPKFEILRSDNTWFKSSSIPKGKPTIIIYFNSQCEHCQKEAQTLVAHKKSFKNVSLIMVSYHDTLKEIKEFAKLYGLNTIPNIIYGRDPVYAIPSFFRVTLIPYIAIYDKDGLFRKGYQGGAPVEELIKEVNK